MNISRFGIGFRFDSVENGDEREHAFNLIFSAIEMADVRGLQLFAGHFPVDESDDKNIFTVAFAGGGIKQTRSLFETIRSFRVRLRNTGPSFRRMRSDGRRSWLFTADLTKTEPLSLMKRN